MDGQSQNQKKNAAMFFGNNLVLKESMTIIHPKWISCGCLTVSYVSTYNTVRNNSENQMNNSVFSFKYPKW